MSGGGGRLVSNLRPLRTQTDHFAPRADSCDPQEPNGYLAQGGTPPLRPGITPICTQRRRAESSFPGGLSPWGRDFETLIAKQLLSGEKALQCCPSGRNNVKQTTGSCCPSGFTSQSPPGP